MASKKTPVKKTSASTAKATKPKPTSTKETPEVNMSRLESFTFFTGKGKSTKGAWLDIPFNDPQVIRILPPVFGQDFWMTEHVFHPCNVGGRRGGWTFKGEQGEYNAMITCLDEYGKGPCPIDELIEWLESDEDGDTSVAEGLYVQKKYIMNVVHEGTIKLWGATPGAAKNIKVACDALAKKKASLADISHPVTGRDIIVTKNGNPKDPKSARYAVTLGDQEKLDFPGWENKAFDIGNAIRFLERPIILEAMVRNLGGLVPIKDIFGKELGADTKKTGKKK